MPPKRARRKPINGPDNSTEEVFDIISISSSDSCVMMTGQRPARRKATASSSRPTRRNPRAASVRETVPEVYRDMISEALSSNAPGTEERPPKRRRTRGVVELSEEEPDPVSLPDKEDEEVDELFEDVMPAATQTIYYSDDGSEFDGDDIFEDVDLETFTSAVAEEEEEEEHLDLNLTITADKTPQRVARKKGRIFSKQERATHLITHKMHMLCLLRYLERRNEWCNDKEVQDILSPLLNEKNRQWFKTKLEWTQFRRSESVKKGLDIAGKIWQTSFKITSRGIRRAYWDEDGDIQQFVLPPDADPVLDISDLKAAARKMEGSRDVGAQLYCALLRSCGLDVRLVCSLQLLPIIAGSKTRPAPQGVHVSRPSTPTTDSESIDIDGTNSPFSPGSSRANGMPFSARRRLGHPNAADYYMPEIRSPTRPPPKPRRKRIIESPYPVFWLEVLDEAHQKWMPVDPLVTGTINKPSAFEPPASDAENMMTYVMAFESDGAIRDVTRRYTKWYLAKVRKNRVESTEGGEKWLRRVRRFYSRGWNTDLDQIEDIELQNIEGREPMPSSIVDFKDHPRYVLERDLRRNEVLVNPHEVGKVPAGRDAKNGRKKLESVYRRNDVKTVRSADNWYRLGREVKIGEQPVKVRAAKRTREDDEEPQAAVSLYTEDQTELYEAPPVVNGRVPRNVYGNLDIYVPSMVPKGGIHLPYPDAARAARLLGIDYADAVTGFEFRGRHGTAVIKGVVIASEYEEAVEAIIEGFRYEERQAEEDRRSLAALRMWKRFMVGMRIKERVDAYEVEGEEKPADAQEDDEGMQSEEYDMDEAGGFLPDDGDDDGGGGFFPE